MARGQKQGSGGGGGNSPRAISWRQINKIASQLNVFSQTLLAYVNQTQAGMIGNKTTATASATGTRQRGRPRGSTTTTARRKTAQRAMAAGGGQQT